MSACAMYQSMQEVIDSLHNKVYSYQTVYVASQRGQTSYSQVTSEVVKGSRAMPRDLHTSGR